MKKIYLDHNATTFMLDEVKEAMGKLPNLPYNASSTHSYGREARKILEEARNKLLNSVGLKDDFNWRVTFTSSGTEANNLLVNSFANDNIIISSIEHSSLDNSVLETKAYYKIKVSDQGLMDLNHLEETLNNLNGKILLSFILANNETGVIQNAKSIIKIARRYNCIIHSDVIQAYGKIPLSIHDLDFDMITISAHKCGGPVGAACLVSKKSIELISMIKGGGQEMGIRSGTENILTIYGFGLVADTIKQITKKYEKVRILRDKMENIISSISSEIEIVSNKCIRLPNTSMIITPNISNKSQLIAFDLANIAISAGSACSSGKLVVSKNLLAMGYIHKKAECAIRVSLGINNDESDIEYFCNEFKKIYNRSKNLN